MLRDLYAGKVCQLGRLGFQRDFEPGGAFDACCRMLFRVAFRTFVSPLPMPFNSSSYRGNDNLV
jgi:hypothetical protein